MLPITRDSMLDEFLKPDKPPDKMLHQNSESLSKFPDGWLKVKLGDICRIIAGGTPSRSVEEYWNGDIPWVKISDIPNNGLIYETEETITKKGLENSNAKILPKGTILFTIFATIGKVGILQIDAATNQAITGIQVQKKDVYVQYLFYCLRHLGTSLLNVGRGAAQYNVNQTILKGLELPLPPLNVQKRIVARIEQLTSQIGQMRKLREEALQDTKAIMQTELRQTFRVQEQKGWEIKKLEEIGKVSSGGTPSRHVKEYFGGSIDWFKARELNDSYLHSSEERITEDALHNSSAKLLPKDTIIIGMYDTAAGKLGMLTSQATTNQACAAVEVGSVAMPKYVLYALRHFRKRLIEKRRGIRQQNLNLGMIKSFGIPVPTLEEQEQIVSSLDTLQKRIKELQEQQETVMRDLESMTQSVLGMAFGGRL